MTQVIEVIDGTPADVSKRLTQLRGQHSDLVYGNPVPTFHPASSTLVVVVIASWIEPKKYLGSIPAHV